MPFLIAEPREVEQHPRLIDDLYSFFGIEVFDHSKDCQQVAARHRCGANAAEDALHVCGRGHGGDPRQLPVRAAPRLGCDSETNFRPVLSSCALRY